MTFGVLGVYPGLYAAVTVNLCGGLQQVIHE